MVNTVEIPEGTFDSPGPCWIALEYDWDPRRPVIMGILERGKDGKNSKVRTTVISNRKKSAIQAEVRKHVECSN